jgi:prevent-host-death family protein
MTITLKQLRNNPGQIAKLVQAGKIIHVTKRGKPLFDLTPVNPKARLVEMNRKIDAIWKDHPAPSGLADELIALSRR